MACTCAENPMVDVEFSHAKNVVVLKAVSVLGPEKSDFKREDSVPGFMFKAQKVFKGTVKPGEEFAVISTGMCSFGFRAEDLASEFLFYYFDDNFSIVPMCSRSGHTKFRAADISYLEKREKVRGLTRISGIVSQYISTAVEGEGSRSDPLIDHTVRIIGNGRDIRLKTDEHGVYEVYGLPPGQYRIEPAKVKGFMATDFVDRETPSAAIVFNGKGHAEMNFYFRIDNAISGRVVDADGKPLERVKLELLPARGTPRKYFVETDYSAKDGSFKFEDVPAGMYVIAGNPKNEITAENPYPLFYSSGTSDRATATEIRVGPGDFLYGFTVKASRSAETVIISGRLLFEDGSPVPSETIKFATGKEGEPAPGDPYTHTDKGGRFQIMILKGQKGTIYGYLFPNTWRFRKCLDRLEFAKANAIKDKDGFLETRRETLEAVEMNVIELKFPFTLCTGR